MAYQMNDLQGSLFTNSYKDPNDPNDRRPHFKGRCMINGSEWQIAAWWAYPQKGGDAYLQLKFEAPRPPQGQQGQQGNPPQPQQPVQPQGQRQYQQPRQQYQQPVNTQRPQGQEDDLPFA